MWENIDKPWGGGLVYCNGCRNPWKRSPCYPAHPACQLSPSARWSSLIFIVRLCLWNLCGSFFSRSNGCLGMNSAWTMAKKIRKWEQVRKKFEDVWRDTDHEDYIPLHASNLYAKETSTYLFFKHKPLSFGGCKPTYHFLWLRSEAHVEFLHHRGRFVVLCIGNGTVAAYVANVCTKGMKQWVMKRWDVTLAWMMCSFRWKIPGDKLNLESGLKGRAE